jgi:putative ATP-binding cassette transporter
MRDALRFGRDVWSLAKPYFMSEDRWAGRGLLAALVALNLAVVGLTVWFNNWDRLFYNALQDRDGEAFLRLIAKFLGMGCVYIAVGVYQVYLNQILQIRWRRWLTDRYLGAWLEHRAYYRMELESSGSGADNPDQRIAEDLRQFVERSLGLAFGMLSAVVTLASFLTILWNLSGTVVIPLGGGAVLHVKGLMVWAALLYAIGGTWLAHKLGRPLAALNFAQQRVEADFRFGLVRLRENAESIALYRGESGELRLLRGRFAAIVANWMRLARMQKRLAWFGSGFNEVAIVFPYLVAAPRYFSGALSLGEMMQTASAFKQVQQSLSFIVYSYTDIAAWRAVIDRLVGFEAAIARARREAAEPAIRVASHGGGAEETSAAAVAAAGLEACGLALRLPTGTLVLNAERFAVARGERVLIAGASGSGKSMLFRALAGIWPFGGGEVRLPRDARTMFLPQRPYLPIGTLREVVLYPEGTGDDAAVREALAAVGLEALAERLDQTAHWANCLSLGEQQRIAAARLLLHRPDWLFLDEATSALDEETEARIYALLVERLPGAAIVSIAHRPGLAAFHGRSLRIMRDRGDRTARLASIPPGIAAAAAE